MVGRAHPLTNDKGPAQLAVNALLLAPDHTFNGGRASAAVFLGPLNAGPAGIGFGFLPFFRLGNRIKITGSG